MSDMRDTIKNHNDFNMPDDCLVAHSAYFLVRARKTKTPCDARYGLTVTKRIFRHAVERNLAKRKLRDWIRFNEKLLNDGLDYIFFARAPILDASREDGRRAMMRALKHIRITARCIKKSKKSQPVAQLD